MALAAQYLNTPLSDIPALSTCMLACAAQLLAIRNEGESDTDDTSRKLVLVAEPCSPIVAVTELLDHESLKADRPGVFAHAVFFAIGTWCHMFDLRPSIMEKTVLYQFLAMIGELLNSTDDGLTMCAHGSCIAWPGVN